jgi:hypothetical protein
MGNSFSIEGSEFNSRQGQKTFLLSRNAPVEWVTMALPLEVNRQGREVQATFTKCQCRQLLPTTPNERTGATLLPNKSNIRNFFAGAAAKKTKTTQTSQQPNRQTRTTLLLIRRKTQKARSHRQRRCTGGQWRRETHFSYMVRVSSYCI